MFSASKTSGPSGYLINNSLRLRSSASAYLNRTPASTTNRRTFTYSVWYKRGEMSTSVQFLWANNASTFQTSISLSSDSGPASNISITLGNGSAKYQTTTTAVFRDPSAWYHIVIAVDTTQATNTNRLKIYVNGEQQTSFSNVNYPPQNFDTWINSNSVAHYIGASYYNGSYTYTNGEGYMTEVNFIDGQALTPSSFGSTNATTGVWQPARYSGTYGTNGFYLNFTDIGLTSGSNAGLGKDFSGNANYWTTNNISVTAGTTYDAMTDVPTLTSATVANYSTLNPLKFAGTLSNANLTLTATAASWQNSSSTLFVNSGKWYFEATIIARPVTYGCMIGIGTPDSNLSTTYGSGDTFTYLSDGTKYGSGSFGGAYGATFTAGDIIGVAFDCDAGTITFYKNNTSQGTAFSNLVAGSLYGVWLGVHTSASSIALNCGQRPFSYTPPSGFVALNTYNLPTSTIKKGNTVMDATLYTGNNTGQTITNAGSFRPDFLWIKVRTNTYSPVLADSVRGVSAYLNSDLTAAEGTNSELTSFNSNGFTLGATGSQARNVSGQNYVGWQWQAGQGSTSSNTQGSITSTVSVSTTAGFSVVTYTSQASSTGTVGHGLGVAPKFIIIKLRGISNNWTVYHASTGATGYLNLNTTGAFATSSGTFANTAPTSSVFTLGTDWAGSYTSVAYCWAEIAGFSKFGSYTGNGSADGPFVYTGFKPTFIMCKRSDGVSNWNMADNKRPAYNPENEILLANSSLAALTSYPVDFLSNGFKIRNTEGGYNTSSGTYIYMAFAETPFKNALAR